MFTSFLTHINQFAVTNGCVPPGFFGLKPWYQYLKTDSKCNVINFTVVRSDGHSDVPLILLVIVDDLLRIAGLVAIGFIIYGAIMYVTSQGSPDSTQRAQGTIQNALIGLVICILSVALVGFIGSRVGA